MRTPYLSIKNRSAPDLHNPESGTKRPGPVPQRSKTAAKRVVAYEAQTAVLGAHVCAARSDFCESHKEKPRGVPSIATTTFPSSAHPSHPGSLRIRPIENPPGPTRTSAPHLSARPEYLKIRTILVGRGCLAAQRALVEELPAAPAVGNCLDAEDFFPQALQHAGRQRVEVGRRQRRDAPCR